MKQQTLDTKIVDGFQIIVGFQERVICPVATQTKNKGVIFELPENQEILEKIKKQNQHRASALLAEKRSIAFLMRNENKDGRGGKETDKLKIQANLSEMGKQDKIRSDFFGSMGVINEELKVLNCACKEKGKQILRDNPVYSDEVTYTTTDDDGNETIHTAGPREGEVILDQAEVSRLRDLFVNKGKNKQILVDGYWVCDYRGKVSYTKSGEKWERRTIEKLDEELTDISIFAEDLTPTQQAEIAAQSETERIEGMTADEKTAEFNSVDDAVLSQAGLMRNKLEIKGDPEALTKSQEFYNTELIELKTKYGVE